MGKSSFRCCVWIERYAGTLGLPDPRHHARSRERIGGTPITLGQKIGSEGIELLIARWRSGTAAYWSNRGFVPQGSVSDDGLEPRRRHHRPSEDIPSFSMGQWANDEVRADPADCAHAIPSRRARRRIGGEHDARAHGGVPCRRWPDRDPRFRELLGTFSSTTRGPKSQDRNAGITSGEVTAHPPASGFEVFVTVGERSGMWLSGMVCGWGSLMVTGG